MDDSDIKVSQALDGVDGAKRDTLRRLVVKGAFVAPIVASFAMSGLTIDRAAAANTTASGAPIP